MKIQIQNDPTAQKYFGRFSSMATDNFINNILSEIDSLQISSILDVGCGTGFMTKRLKAHSSNCIACDINISRLKLAREYTLSTIPLVAADITHLPFKKSTFDLLVVAEVLEHVPDTHAMLRELVDVSRRYVLITVPNEPIFRTANFFRGKNLTRFGNPEDHIHHFNMKSLKELLYEYFSEVVLKTNSTFWLMANCRL